MKLEKINHGLTYILEDGTIQYNEKLDQEPQLRDFLIHHEKQHEQLQNFLKELHMDVKDQISYKLIKFAIKNPSTWTAALPLRKHKGTIYYDINTILIWITIITIPFFILYLLL